MAAGSILAKPRPNAATEEIRIFTASGFDSVSIYNGLPLSSSKAWTPSLDSLRYLLDADAIFLLAIFIATSVYSAGVLEPVHDIDISILLHMFFGDVYSVFFELAFSTERRDMPISAWGVRYRALVIGGMSAYAVWFWFTGLYRLPAPPCGSVAFLFAKVALRGRAQTFFEVVAIVNFLVWGGIALASLVAFPFDPYFEFVKAQATRKTRYSASTMTIAIEIRDAY